MSRQSQVTQGQDHGLQGSCGLLKMPGVGGTQKEPKPWGQHCTQPRECRRGWDSVWGESGRCTPSPHRPQVHKAILQQLKVRGVVGTESQSLAGMERDVNISDPRGAQPGGGRGRERVSGSPSSASGSSAASPASAAAGREQRGDNRESGVAVCCPWPRHLP